MPIEKLTSLFKRAGGKRAGGKLPSRIVTSKFRSRGAYSYFEEAGLQPVPKADVQLKATRLHGSTYRITAHYTAAVQEFTPYSIRTMRTEKAKVEFGHKQDETDMLRVMADFEAAGRGAPLKPDNLGTPPRQLDGATHIVNVLKNAGIFARLRPDIFIASRLRNIRKQKFGDSLCGTPKKNLS